MDATELLARLVERHHGFTPTALHPLRVLQGRGIYRVERSAAPQWVLRAFQGDAFADDLRAHVAVLAFLEQEGFPATRLVRALDGSAVVEHDGWWAIMTTYIEGAEADYSPANLRWLGEALGRLHTLDLRAGAAATPPVLPAARLPTQEAPEGLALLAGVAERVPRDLRTQYEAYVAALRRVPAFAGLPQALLHTDPFPGNAILTPDGDLALMDWDNAGLGPAVLDVGYLLITCDKGLQRIPEVHPDPARIAALVEGYVRRRTLAGAELEALADSMRYGPAVRGAWHVATALTTDAPPDAWQLWWARYQAAEETAALARECFERLRTNPPRQWSA